MGETCCICFPLECGVKVLAIVIILDAIFTGGFWVAYPDGFETFWPFYITTVIMALTFLYTLIAQSEESRKHAFFVWVFLYLGLQLVLYAWKIFSGKIGSWQCHYGLDERNTEIVKLEEETGADLGGALT